MSEAYRFDMVVDESREAYIMGSLKIFRRERRVFIFGRFCEQ